MTKTTTLYVFAKDEFMAQIYFKDRCGRSTIIQAARELLDGDMHLYRQVTTITPGEVIWKYNQVGPMSGDDVRWIPRSGHDYYKSAGSAPSPVVEVQGCDTLAEFYNRFGGRGVYPFRVVRTTGESKSESKITKIE